ncbi:intermembrane phospholipid transport protein YdbH family protein [Pseudomonas benzenivorans]|uniref:YdbH domain-containing protein n=1 Tax=Pseudomonas benzenivorans TaxID=556533 RepID=A0ABY5HC79_9PSED|nr:YdbH domain-containing protein [Pseudomonas benzenivorans]UTW08601.1 YdbH domain-containing protein [Pseudomonas benzenivorans]
MISRRTWLRLSCLLLVLALLGGYAYLSWGRLLERQHIQRFDWHTPRLTPDGLSLRRLELQQQSPAGTLQLQIVGLQLGWRDFSLEPPFWQQVRIERLALQWRPAAERAETAEQAPPLDFQALGQLLAALPRSLVVEELLADLPCAKGHCELRGDLHQTRTASAGTQLEMQLQRQGGDSQLSVNAQLHTDADTLELQLALALDQRPQLSLHSSLQRTADGQQWHGELAAPTLNESAVLRTWLEDWAPLPELSLPGAPSAAQLSASWQLQLPQGAPDLDLLRRASGRLSASGTLPEPWPIPGLGQLQGEFSLALLGLDGHWRAEQLAADLTVQQPLADWQRTLPATLRSDSLQLRIEASESQDVLADKLTERALPLAIHLRGQGSTPFELRAQLALTNAPPWAAQLTAAQLDISSPRLDLADWQARKLKASLQFEGYLDAEQLSLDLLKGSQLNLERLTGSDLQLKRLRADLAGLQLQAQLQDGAAEEWRLEGPLGLRARRLAHPALITQGWRWQGRLKAIEEQIELNGRVSADSDLQLPVQLSYDGNRGLHAHAQLPELFLRAGNPLAKTLAHWPALLELNRGRLSASAVLNLPPNQATALKLDLTAKGLAGIYDRAALSGLDARAQVNLARGELRVTLAELRLKEANPGVPVGPLQLRADYRAPIAQLDRGLLELHQAQAGLMGGTVRVAPDRWRLERIPLLVPLELRGLQLNRLFTLYPAEGLAGTGIFDGQLPLHLSTEGIQVERGRIAARTPGGRLQLRSERIRALGSSNPTMQLVTQSLEDFHFTTLRSQVDYDPQGKLLLTMRLEGQNPAIEQGRPIHFNINLEEDIPSLLASLQLTDKVNEIIRRRVQQRILERNANAAPKEP